MNAKPCRLGRAAPPMKSRASNKSAPGGKSPDVRSRQSGRTHRVWSRYSDIGLQRRVMAYAFIGMAALAAIFAFVALDAVDKSTDAILRERLNLAKTVAQSVDQTILASKSLVSLTASDLGSASPNSARPGELTGHEIAMLESLRASLAGVNAGTPPESVILFDADGQVVWETHLSAESKNVIPSPEFFDEAASPSVSASGQGYSTFSVGTDISGNSELARLGAVILPSHRLLAVAGQTDAAFGEYRLELLDSSGRVIANSSGERPNDRSRHMDVIGDVVFNRVEGVGEHSLVAGDEAGVDHIVAYAPLSSVPWGVVLAQREDAALALPNSLRQRVLIIAAAGLAAGLTMAWITSRQVVLPLARLTGQAKRIAEGDLSGSIAPEGQDEVRRLAVSFETMRGRLEASQRELADWSTELEERVRERTAQLEQRDRERSVLLNKVISAQEDERKRIARDLHDQIGQTLTGLVMQIGGAEATLSDDQAAVKKQLADLGESASEAVEEVRRMMSDLRPSVLDDMGLESAVSWYTENHLEREGINVVLDLQRSKTPLSPNVEISAFRVYQEAITNVIKHSSASNVRISLAYDEDRLSGTIEDDGIGFEVSAVQPGADGGWAVGLLGMTERANLLGGSLRIDSSPGKGTTVNFEIPLEGAAHNE